MPLTNQVALVTGGAAGLGKAIAQRLALDGAQVVITDVRAELGRATAAEGGFTFIAQDVCDEDQWTAAVAEIEERLGHLDILVNNAGILEPLSAASPETLSFSNWKRVFAVNVDGVFLGCRAVIPAMRRAGGGAIVNISSMTGLLASSHATAYGASKAAVRQLTKSVAQHCAQEKLNIRCNSVHPGNVHTTPQEGMWVKYMEEKAVGNRVALEKSIAEAKDAVPLGELVTADDVAAAVSFLVSAEARRITGEKLIVDGGSVNCGSYRMSAKRAIDVQA